MLPSTPRDQTPDCCANEQQGGRLGGRDRRRGEHSGGRARAADITTRRIAEAVSVVADRATREIDVERVEVIGKGNSARADTPIRKTSTEGDPDEITQRVNRLDGSRGIERK